MLQKPSKEKVEEKKSEEDHPPINKKNAAKVDQPADEVDQNAARVDAEELEKQAEGGQQAEKGDQ